MRKWVLIGAVATLSACQMGLPAAQKDGVDPAPQTADSLSVAFADAAVAAGVDTKPKPGLFAFLKPAPAPSPLAGTGIEVVESADVEREEVPDTALASAQIQPAVERKPLFGFLARKEPPLAGTSVAEEEGAAETQEVSPTVVALAAETSAEAPPRRGLFAFLKNGAAQAEVTPTAAALAAPVSPPKPVDKTEAPVEVALAPAPEETPRPRKPLFGFLQAGPRASAPSGKPVATVAPGEVLPFGTVGLACDTPRKALGRAVDHFPREGAVRWRLYDTAPESSSARTQFITGFADGCPRQVTAALVVFGSAGLHEVHRYSKAMSKARWSEADLAYEAIKKPICGTGKGKLCPADKLPQLEDQLAFLTVYPTYGADRWLELLVAGGALISEEMR